MKYIGPFLKLNSLSKEGVKSQLFFFSKESLKHIVFYSRCGIPTSTKELRIKTLPNFDITTFKYVSPLLCVYKKGSAKLINQEGKLCWNEEKMKKEIDMFSNSLMTLSLLELSNYYKNFRDIDIDKFSMSNLYLTLSKHQLEFYASYFRNSEGVFIDKLDVSNSLINEYAFEDKDKNFKFSNQAFLMVAFYQYYLINKEDKDSANYKNFSFDILNMLLQFRDKLYALSIDEISKICLALNVFYSYSKDNKAQALLIDLMELMIDNYKTNSYAASEERLKYDCMLYLNCYLLQKHTGIQKFSDTLNRLVDNLVNLYDSDYGIFMKYNLKKETEFSCTDIMLYLTSIILCSEEYEDRTITNDIIKDVFKNQVIGSGVVLSWPEAPDLNEGERYRNYSMLAEDLIEEQFFRMPTIPTPDGNELAPVFVKNVTYNIKKGTFKSSRGSFDSRRNFLIIYLLIYLLKPELPTNKIIDNLRIKDVPKNELADNNNYASEKTESIEKIQKVNNTEVLTQNNNDTSKNLLDLAPEDKEDSLSKQ